ncbi:hypothetical protein CRUP_006316 [Coryphaenoides rupestris]|nr:hypothetical protein CRUP_006316 [Coryphaenoides rupestris]
MRRLTKKKALHLVKGLDAFPKVPESYVESTASGGTVSLIAFTFMAILAFLEFFVYRETWMQYEYEVDKDFKSKLRLNVDITVAMKCQYIGADVLDLAETMVASDGLIYEPVNFELSPQQRFWHMTLQHIQERLREEHSLQHVLFKEDQPSQPPAACRIHGHLYVNKVAGNFHITYDISSLMVRVTEQHMPLWKFLVRLCGIVGGIFSTTGLYRQKEEPLLNHQDVDEDIIPAEGLPR